MNTNNLLINLINQAPTECNKIIFSNESISQKTISGIRFEECVFKQCSFDEITFVNCEFIETEFINCNLSLAKLINTRFYDVVFESSKLVGIDWTRLKWPQVKLSCPMKFYQCDLSFSYFFETHLVDAVFEQCKAHEVDFRGADLSYASFCYTDFYKTLFQHCNLTKADFTGATNYFINIEENNISKAKFSFPEVIGLITPLDIIISGLK